MRVFALACAVTLGMTVLPQAQSDSRPDAGPDSRPSFSEWLNGVRADAVGRGIRSEIVDEALATVQQPEPTVIERDRTQAEIVLPLEAYVARRLTTKVVRDARAQLASHRMLLGEVSARYGVPPALIVGIWGIESNFGRFSGVRPTIAALATLAWDGRRALFFRGELLDALEILDRGDVDLAHLRGSWAGAMGQPQFMPSSYRRWAQDFDGDGRRDIWSSAPDVFASIANYLAAHGWQAGQTWGQEVVVEPEAARRVAMEVGRRDGSCQAKRDMTVALPLARWQELGVRTVSGHAFAEADQMASLVSGAARHFLVHANYDALLEYNCAHSYAISVALLADRAAGPPSPQTSRGLKPRARASRRHAVRHGRSQGAHK